MRDARFAELDALIAAEPAEPLPVHSPRNPRHYVSCPVCGARVRTWPSKPRRFCSPAHWMRWRWDHMSADEVRILLARIAVRLTRERRADAARRGWEKRRTK